jgi:hypothetical protein
MLPKSVHNMLKLHDQWRSYHAGSVAADLVSQVADASLQTEAWRHLITAALDGMVEGWAKKTGSSISVEERPKLTWRIKDVIYVYLPEVSYDVLEGCSDFGPLAPCLTVFTPPRKDILLRKLLVAMLGNRVPSVWPIDTYLSYRAFLALAESATEHDRVLLRLLREYNHRIAESRLDESLLVEIPSN